MLDSAETTRFSLGPDTNSRFKRCLDAGRDASATWQAGMPALLETKGPQSVTDVTGRLVVGRCNDQVPCTVQRESCGIED